MAIAAPRGSASAALRAFATAVMRENDTGRYTVPSRMTYPHQWNWDCALSALGWAELDPGRAWTELESLVGARDAGGMVPHVAFHTRLHDRVDGPVRGALTRVARPRARYMPGPRWYGQRTGADGRRISGITQPPLAATCARILFEDHPDEARARRLLRPLAGWHRFLLDDRDPFGYGEPTLIHPWESGRDNAVEWDAPLWRVMPEVTVLRRRDTASVEAAERPSDEHYRRFLTLIRRGTRVHWEQAWLARAGSFRVLDPGFSAVLAAAGADLAWLAAELGDAEIAEEGAATAERVSAALATRADADGVVRPLDLTDGRSLHVTSAGSALALLAPGLGTRFVDAAEALVDAGGVLGSAYGVRSLDRAHAERSSRNYWRGPVWANITWLCAVGLARHGRTEAAVALDDQMLHAVRGGGMREYFAPESGRGLGARDFTWTAALTLRALSR